MAAHIITDTACLPSLTCCSCSHNHVKPAAPSQRLTQRSSAFISSQQTCRIPRRRLGRSSTQVWTAICTNAAVQSVTASFLSVINVNLHADRCTSCREAENTDTSSRRLCKVKLVCTAPFQDQVHAVLVESLIQHARSGSDADLSCSYETMIVLRPDMNDESR